MLRRRFMPAQLEALPRELFDDILSDIFSDHIHCLLVKTEVPLWDPFRTLPLVSHAFHESCQTLFHHIFGPLEDYETIHDILDDSLTYWNQANQPPTRARPVDDVPEEELKNSLIQVYICAAIAKSYLNLDVLWHLELERKRITGELDDANCDTHFPDENDDTPPILHSRMFKMRDDNMHRLFRPLTFAIILCDRIRPERLAYIVADYLAEMLPFYSTAPIILKSAQDLETYVSEEYRLPVGIETLSNWTRQALTLADRTRELLKEMQEIGKLVQSFKRSSSIPLRVLEETHILEALDQVATANWGEDTPNLNEHARAVKVTLQAAD